jgi:hypothetical protein
VGSVVDKVVLGQVFPRVLRFSPVNLIPPVPHYLENKKKRIIFLFVFIIGLHNKPYGCGVSVEVAAGFFSIQKTVCGTSASNAPFVHHPADK